MKALCFIAVVILTHYTWGSSQEKKASSKTLALNFICSDQSVNLSPEKRLPFWSKKKTNDPNSGETLTYYGYWWSDLINHFQTTKRCQNIKAFSFRSSDGYIVKLSPEELKKTKAFLALKVDGVSQKGIFNKSLNTYFDWRPGYLILSGETSLSSPYQIEEIKALQKESLRDFIAQIPKPYQKGAKIFKKTCIKCHSYKGQGGLKAPPIQLMVNRWKKDKDLKKFLRNPQQVLKRKIQMSAYDGSNKELTELLKFLRFTEQ